MEFPLVSILVPAYNHAPFIEECLDGVLGDPYPNKELIIVDDGSTDGTGDKIAAWVARHSDSIPIDYRRRENRGVSATLNELASKAKGEFLRLNASDDYILPGGLRSQVEYLLAHPRKLAVIGDSVVINEKGETLFESGMADLRRVNKEHYRSDAGIRREIISRWALGGPVQMVRKQVFELIGGWNEDLKIEDWDFFLRLAAVDGLGFIDLKVCAYRLHGKNTSRTQDVAERISNLGDAAKTAEKHVKLFEEPYKSRLRAQCYLIAAKIAYLKRQPIAVAVNMGRFAWMRVLARLKTPASMLQGVRPQT